MNSPHNPGRSSPWRWQPRKPAGPAPADPAAGGPHPPPGFWGLDPELAHRRAHGSPESGHGSGRRGRGPSSPHDASRQGAGGNGGGAGQPHLARTAAAREVAIDGADGHLAGTGGHTRPRIDASPAGAPQHYGPHGLEGRDPALL